MKRRFLRISPLSGLRAERFSARWFIVRGCAHTRTGRVAIIAAVAIVWLAMMGALVQKDILSLRSEKTGYRSILTDRRREYSAEYEFQLEEQGRLARAGQLTEFFAYNQDGTFTITENLQVEVGQASALLGEAGKGLLSTLLGAKADKIKLSSQTRVDANYQLSAVHFSLDAGQIQIIGRGTVQNEHLVLSIWSADKRLTRTIPWKKDEVMGTGIGGFLPESRLRAGDHFKLAFLDLMTLERTETVVHVVGKERLKIAGEELTCYKLEVSYGAAAVKAWASPEGEIVRAELPLGLQVVKVK